MTSGERCLPRRSMAIRITSAASVGGSLRVAADIAAAYPQTAGLAKFRRIFTADAANVTVTDEVATAPAKVVEWFVHSDVPITRNGGGFVVGGDSGLRVTLEGLKVETRIEPTLLTAPGQPGSITKG